MDIKVNFAHCAKYQTSNQDCFVHTLDIKVVKDLLIHNGIIEEQYFSLENLLYVEEPFS